MAGSRCMCHLLLAVMLSAVSGQLQVQFTTQPIDVTVREGAATASITCQVSNLDRSSHILSFERGRNVISDDQTIRGTVLEGLGLDSSRYKIRSSYYADTQSRDYSLSIDSPSRNDSGRYRCVVCRRDGAACDANHIFTSSDEVTLTVNYPPADSYPVCAAPTPSSTAAPNSSFLLLVEGASVEIVCSSEIASPPVRLTWTEDGAQVSEDQVKVSNKDGIRESRLTVTPTKKDNGTVWSCAVTSDVFNETARNCSFPPLSVVPKGSDGPGGTGNSTGVIIIIVLAVIVVLLVVAIAVAYFTKRKKQNGESRGHKIEYQPAETADTDNEGAGKVEMNRDID